MVLELFPNVVQWRRELHKIPELAFEEFETAAFVSKILTQYNIAHQTQIAKTGIVALIEGKNPNKRCIALRADLDALPILEGSTHAYISKNEGKMHACGHDYHTASLLGVAVIISQLKAHLEGSVKFIFQPSEEKMPGGAAVMIANGVLENPKVNLIIGQHVSPELPTGSIGIKAGEFMASADEIYLTVKGKGGHAAFPEKINDPIIAAAQILIALQQVVSRKKDAFTPAVLSFGKVIAEGATNVVPDEVHIAGTLRTMHETWRKEAHYWIKNIAENSAKSLGCTCEVDIVVGYPCLHNDEALTTKVSLLAKEILGEEKIVAIDKRMGAEDFAYYSQEIPACFLRIGTGSKPETQYGLHTPQFDIDENAFKSSLALFSWLALTIEA